MLILRAVAVPDPLYAILFHMKQLLTLLLILMVTMHARGQNRLVLKQFALDTNSALIAVCPFYDKQKVYHNYSFYINKNEDLKMVSETLSYGEKAQVDAIDEHLNIYIIQDKEVLPIQIGASPKYGYINIEDSYYTFSIAQLQKLAQAYPLTYTARIMKFKKEEEFAGFLKKYKPDPTFLCFEDITEELEGICSMTVKIASGDKPASQGWDIIENDLKKIGAEKEIDYIISYKPAQENTDIYHYQVRLNKKLYDKLNNPAYAKGKWTMNIKEIITYWKK